MTPNDPAIVYCQNPACGAPIGSYTERDGKVQLDTGALIIDVTHAACKKCGEPFHWHTSSSERTLTQLVNRVLQSRKKEYGMIAPMVV